MNIAILLLCHEPAALLAKQLSSPFFCHPRIKVYIHYDGSRKPKQLEQLRALIPLGVNFEFTHSRVKCAWGEYSLVEATALLMQAALEDSEFEADYLYLVSGSCTPIRPANSLIKFFELNKGTDFIESVDISKQRWVLNGSEEERFHFYHPFNFRTQRRLFEASNNLQRFLGIRKSLPPGLRIHFGSQWFAITKSSGESVISQLLDPSMRKFLRTSWIPDEFAVQSLIRGSQNAGKISNHSLTYYEFDPDGRPLVLDNGHFDHIMNQPFFFARKISPTADTLLTEINTYLQEDEVDLDYFSRIGQPTATYRSYLARCSAVGAARSKVATVIDPWRGVMDSNERAYYVIWSSSRDYIKDIIQKLQSTHKGPVYGYLFDSTEMDLGSLESDPFGLNTSMIGRRNIAPDSVLFEAANAHPTLPCIFAIDPADSNWARDFVLWDSNATLICCEPEKLTKIQRAEAYLRHPRRHWERSLVNDIYQAAFTNSWLPFEHYDRLKEDNSAKCNFLNLFDLRSNDSSEALRSLRTASELIDGSVYFLTDHLAWVNLRKAQLRGPIRHGSKS